MLTFSLTYLHALRLRCKSVVFLHESAKLRKSVSAASQRTSAWERLHSNCQPTRTVVRQRSLNSNYTHRYFGSRCHEELLEASKWETFKNELFLQGCLAVFRLDLELQTSCSRTISNKASRLKREADSMDREQLSQLLQRKLTSLHLLFMNFEQAWHELVALELGQSDSFHNDYTAKLDVQARHRAEAAACKLLLHQLRSQHTQSLTEIVHSSASRCATAASNPVAFLCRLLHVDNRSKLLRIVKLGHNMDVA